MKFFGMATASKKPGFRISLRNFNTSLMIFTVVAMALLLLCILVAGGGAERKGFNLLLIAAACFAGGAFMGFLYGTFGTEAERFKNIAGILNGLIGGFALSDLSKNESMIRRVLHAMSRSAGQGDEVGVVAAVMVTFGVLGFLLCYMNKTLSLNLAFSEVQRSLDVTAKIMVEQAAEAAKGERSKAIGDPEALKPAGEGVKESPELMNAVAQLMASPELAEDESPQAIKTKAKAFYVCGDMKKAEREFSRLLDLRPDDAEALSYLSEIRVERDPLTAIEPLERLRRLLPEDHDVAKWLGYAYLWRKDKLKDAIRESTRYLERHPKDVGAKLNLACAYAQQGPSPELREIVLPLVKDVVEQSPAAKDVIVRLMEDPEGDFFEWKDDDKLLRLLEPKKVKVTT